MKAQRSTVQPSCGTCASLSLSVDLGGGSNAQQGTSRTASQTVCMRNVRVSRRIRTSYWGYWGFRGSGGVASGGKAQGHGGLKWGS